MAYSAPGFRKCGSRRRRRRSFKGSSVSFTLSISHVSIRTVVPRGGKSFFFFIRFPLPLQTLKGVSTHTTTILERGESEDGRGDGLLWGGGCKRSAKTVGIRHFSNAPRENPPTTSTISGC